MTNSDIDKLLTDVNTTIRRFCLLPGAHEYTAVTLWCAYTHFSHVFDYAPRLIARSPHKRSGKTRLLEIVAELARGPVRSVNMGIASIYRLLDADPNRTLILDEVDALFGTKAKAVQNEDLRALLNAGFQRGNPVWRTVGQNFTPTAFETFAPVAMAGIGRLPDTIEDRSVVIPMRRKSPNENIEPYRSLRNGAELHAHRDRLAQWAEVDAERARDYAYRQCVNLPVYDRAADVWEPLLIIAALAGGDWLEAGRDACRAMVSRAGEDDTDASPGQQLLANIRVVLDDDFMASMDLCTKLRFLPESPWAEENLTTHRLGHMLAEYGIKSRHSTDKARRGYYAKDFTDAWARYLSDEASEPSEASGQHTDQWEPSDISTDGATAETTETSQQNIRSTPIPDTSDTSDALFDTCPRCGRATTLPGKCGPCIADRVAAATRATNTKQIAQLTNTTIEGSI